MKSKGYERSMNTSEVTHKSSKRKKFSQADKTAPELKYEDIFIETPEEKAERERIERIINRQALTHEFTAGKTYFIGEQGKFTSIYRNSFIFTYQGKQGRHHMFRHFQGNWSRTYTDAQLIGKFIKEIEA